MASGPRNIVFSTLAKTESIRKDNVTKTASTHIAVASKHIELHSTSVVGWMMWYVGTAFSGVVC